MTAPSLRLTEFSLEGDRQADTKERRSGGQVHGGPDRAVYAFPAEHYARFEGFEATFERPHPRAAGRARLRGRESDRPGVTEAEVRIGDVWAWD